MTAVSPLLTGLCDDAALFPPGNAPLTSAVPAHFAHLDSVHADLVGPFVFPAPRLDELAAVVDGDRVLEISLTVPAGTGAAPAAIDRLRGIAGTRLVALEIAVPEEQTVSDLFTGLREIAFIAGGVDIYVEVPRDARRTEILAGLADTPYRAKFRTGGVVAEAYPDDKELAAAIEAAVSLGVPFKATAGLHHAVRNTAPDTGFEQHGFLNLMLATHRAASGAGADAVAAVLAERDGVRLAEELAALPDEAARSLRDQFRSYGTCSIGDPLTDLTALGLMGAPETPAVDEGNPA
ncbi:conserved hypothetical protein [Rhodococcus sp. RD6.2]|uniref:hypothetical protein n=1 Tax=Rhodococcus sp. RD6.2 TaxID=260936 RepID=UPI00063B7108|nr:hypothetical protein [Rhodococcus sp. RD6.2]CRK50795.1 conserved hypothetical protein [Rhodococcus sp. RD6.2]